MDFNNILFIIIWLLSILLIIHFSHKIISFVTENFDDHNTSGQYTNPPTTSSPAVVSTPSPNTTRDPNIHNDSSYKCNVSNCPLASVLSSYPDIGEKWGDNPGECVKVINSNNAVCARCPPGTFIDYSNINEVCTVCPPGTYSDKHNSLSCKICQNENEAGENRCDSDSSEESNTFNASVPDQNNLTTLYNNNMANYQQFQALNGRINRLNDIMNSL